MYDQQGRVLGAYMRQDLPITVSYAVMKTKRVFTKASLYQKNNW